MDHIFLRRRVRPDCPDCLDRLAAFGFVPDPQGLSYTTPLLDGHFLMTVTVDSAGHVSTEVLETAHGESYVLHLVPAASGAFVGQVREEYRAVLTRMAEACCEPEVFKSAGARAVMDYVREKYGHELEYLWPRFPDNAIVRRSDTAKWYLALLTVQRAKLGLAGEGAIEVMDLRMQPEDVAALVDGRRYLPGYHMNKKHWVTLLLEEPLPLPLSEIFSRIDTSFALATR